MNLKGYPAVLSLPVLWGDQDLYGHVNNGIYLKWFESARVAYWEQTAVHQYMTPRNLGPILASVACDFKRQLRYPDQIEVGARTVKLGRTSMTMEHAVYSTHHGAIAATGRSVVVLFDYGRQSSEQISDQLREIITQCEQQAAVE